MQNNKIPRRIMRALRLAEWGLPAIFWLLLLFGFDSPPLAISTLIAAALHELGHIAYLLARGGISLFSPRANGFRLYPSRSLSYKEEMLLAAAGPASNLLSAALFAILSAFAGEYFQILALFNLMTMASNLLPIEGQDGYNILRAFFSERFAHTESVLKRISFTFSVLLTFLALYLIEKLNTGYWIFALFSVYVYTFIRKSQKTAFFEHF